MLTVLSIENFLLIRRQEVEFDRGLNVITGESGSGKSMLLSSIAFLLGEEGQYEDDTVVEGGFLIDGEEVFIRREVRSGRSHYFIDGRRASLRAVRELLSEHVLFQGQDDRLKVLRADFQRDAFDRFAKAYELRREHERLYDELSASKNALADYHRRHREFEIRKALILQELQEIESLSLDAQDYRELKERLRLLSHAERFNKLVSQAIELLDAEGGLLRRISELRKVIAELSKEDPSFSPWARELKEIKERLSELNLMCRRSVLDTPEEELDRLNSLMFQVQRLERRYGKSFEEVLEYAQELRGELQSLESSHMSLEELEEKVRRLQEKLESLSKELRSMRLSSREEFEKRVKGTLKSLGLGRASFRVELVPAEGRFGREGIRFLFSSLGYEEKPLEDVASGGEVSRLALALFLLMPPKGVYVMDEVDTGLSGQSAMNLARLLKELSKSMQIITITHSPTLASAGDKHFMAYREGDAVRILELAGEERLKELARLMGKLTPKTLEGARELITEFSDV